MSAIARGVAEFGRALGDARTFIASAEAWRDPQRSRLDRARLEPLQNAAAEYLAALTELDAALDEASRLLNRGT